MKIFQTLLKGKLTYITAAGSILFGLSQVLFALTGQPVQVDMGEALNLIVLGLGAFGIRRALPK